MKLQLIVLGILLSSFQYSLGAEANPVSFTLENPQNLIAVSGFFQAAAIVAMDAEGHLRLPSNNIRADHFQWLQTIADASQKSTFAVKDVCRTIGALNLAPLLASARSLEITPAIQTTMIETLAELLSQNLSFASLIDPELVGDPIGKLAVIKAITKKKFSAKTKTTKDPITSVCLSPDGKFIVTTHKDNPHAYLWKTTSDLYCLGRLPFLDEKTQKVSFNESGDKVTLITDHVVAVFTTGNLEESIVDNKETVSTIFICENSKATFHDVKATFDDRITTLLYKDKTPETFQTESKTPLKTALPAGSKGLFDLFGYHPDYHNNSVVGTTAFDLPDTAQVWNQLTGQILYDIKNETPVKEIYFKQYRQEILFIVRQAKKVTTWNDKNPQTPFNVYSLPQNSKAFYLTEKHNSWWVSDSPEAVASYSNDGNFIAAAKGRTLTFQANSIMTPPSIKAALDMIHSN